MAETPKKKSWHAPKGAGKKACTVEGCKRPYRAKSYCSFHYDKWRLGELPHSRFKTCSKEDCKKRVFKAGLCESHYTEKHGKAEAAAPAA